MTSAILFMLETLDDRNSFHSLIQLTVCHILSYGHTYLMEVAIFLFLHVWSQPPLSLKS